MKKTLLLTLALLIPAATSMIHAGPDETVSVLIVSTATGVGLYGLYKLSQGLCSAKKPVRVTSKAISSIVCAGSALITAIACGEFAHNASYGNSLEFSSNRNFAIGFGIVSSISVLGSCLFAESAIKDIIAR